MNIVNKLTLRHLKENKGRSVITTLGIIVSVAMITAVFVAMASFLNLEGTISYMQMGHKDAVFAVDTEQLEKLKKDDRLSAVGVNTDLFQPSFQLEQKSSVRTGTGEIYCGDSVNLQQMMVCDYEGEIPQNSKEIAVEQSLIDMNKLDWKIGDTVTIPMGVRYTIEGDERMEVKGSYFSGEEEFSVEEIGEFKITAILKENSATSNYSIIRGLDMSELVLSDGETINATVNLKNVNYKSIDVIKDIVKDYNIEEYAKNSEYLASKLAIDPNSSVFSLLPIILIILIIIMIASVVLIYNSFAMSINERVRYLGMLASVGATKAQKKMSAYYEGIILGAIGIPVGILSGIAGIGITLKAVGGKIISTGMLAGIDETNTSFDVVVPLWAIIGIVVFSVLTIFISSFIPSKKASSVTPIDAIRQRQEIKVKAKKLKSPKIIRTIFGYEGELANKNLKRNGRKARVITASIALSVILFLSCNYFCQIFMQAGDMSVDIPYQIQVTFDEQYYDGVTKELKKINNVDNYYSTNNSTFYLSSGKTDDPLIAKSVSEAVCKKENLTDKYRDLFEGRKYFMINGIEDEDFNKLCQDNDIDYKQFYNGEPKLLLMNNINHKENSSKVFDEKILGTKFDFFDNMDESHKCDVEIAGFVDYDKDNYVLGLNPSGSISCYVPVSVYKNVIYDGFDKNELTYTLGVETKQHEQVYDDIKNVFDTKDLGNAYVVDTIAQFQMMNTIMFVMQVFVYGFIALITLITLFNIINTISNSTMLRKKEFAMFKSVGITPSGFNKMVVLESAFYGIKALVFALPISALVSFGINKALGEEMIPFEINWLMYLAVIGAVFVVVGMTMIYSVHKIKNDSIVETLKEEIN
ncbi:MAG: FtsX-like permease family protein [Eubacterium sp.]|nr:FtsX-like permease family protein [Eubacterium sp.]